MLLISPDSVQDALVGHCKQERIRRSFTQKELADRAQVSLSVLRKFEQTGKIALESFVRIIYVLGLGPVLVDALERRAQSVPATLDEVLDRKKEKPRQRVYKSREKTRNQHE